MFSRFSKILIVDDSTVARKILRGLLGQLGHENIEEAGNGLTALAMLHRQSFRLVISDWYMAPMSGLDLLEAMRRSPHLMQIPFIMMTAQSQKKFIEIARDNGATLYLAKPFTSEALAERMAIIGRSDAAHPISV